MENSHELNKNLDENLESNETTAKKRTQEALVQVQDYLARRSHSELELKQKLTKKGFDDTESQYAIEYAKAHNWMEDPEELSQKVYSEWDSKNKSHLWINNYLEKKGLNTQNKNSKREIAKAHYHLKKKFGKITETQYKKASSTISSKGFTYGEFKEALEKLNSEQSYEE